MFAFTDRQGRVWAMLSRLEVLFAEWLDRQELSWYYEPPARLLSNGRRYQPDFWVDNWESYVEVSGGFNAEQNRRRLDQFRSDGYPIRFYSRRELTELWGREVIHG